MEKKKGMIRCYDRLYKDVDGNFKEAWDGRIAVEYKVPKYLRTFLSTYNGMPAMRVLELGAGNGEISELIRAQKPSFIKSYVATEISAEGVKRLKQRGFTAYQADAQDLSRFNDDSFDLVFAFDVMHHVSDPRKMAQEMLRVSNKHIFLIEANGLCVIRKALERVSKKYREAGEGSYTPWQYKGFFSSPKLGRLHVRPFLFMVPFTPGPLIQISILASEVLEHLPIVRWQGSGVVIVGEKR